jgi:regulator of PEP synthase PpsR (kinase-PPPase family)
MSAVIFEDSEAMSVTETAIQQLRDRLGLKKTYEFHFNSTSNRVREEFCKTVCNSPFIIRAIVMDKSRIYVESMLHKSSSYFYNYTVKMLLKHNFGSITNAKVTIDGKMNRELKTYLHKELNQETKLIHDVDFEDSKSNDLIQLADMVAGSISRSYKTDKKDALTYIQILRPCIENVWEFGKK